MTRMKNIPMKNIFLLLCVFGFIAGSAFSQQPVDKRSTGYPDLDLYYRQLDDKSAEAYKARSRHLQATIPADTLIQAYIDKRQGVWSDTIHLFLLFNEWHTILAKEEQRALLDKMYVVARKQKNKPLERLADLFDCQFKYTDSQTYEENMEYYEQTIRKFRKAGDIVLETMALENMRFASFCSHRFLRTCTYASRLAKALERAGEEYPYPRRIRANFAIGQTYYFFNDYERALPFLYKASFMEGWNYLATYHQVNNNLDSALYYHRKILSESELRHDFYSIAISNIGRIEQNKGNIDAAIAMLEAGLDYMQNMQEDGFISGLHTSLAECYMEKGAMNIVREHIHSARARIGFEFINNKDIQNHYRRKAIFAVESSYFARLGLHEKAKLSLDSALMLTTLYEQLSGKDNILLGEQQLQEAEAQLRQQQIARQRSIIFYVLIILTFICGALIVLVRLYRKKNAAYKALAIKAEEWANNSITPPVLQPCAEITKEDEQIMLLLEKEMQNFAYREVGLTTEILADRLGVHRNALSHAINCVTGGNFNAYINGFRIKEAVRIISQTSHKELYIDELYGQVGFGNRTSFYRSFKQLTGLSPIEFQKSKNSSLSEFNF